MDLSKGQWQYLLAELKSRTLEPLKSVPFVFYAVVGIVVFGAAGIWIELPAFFAPGAHDATRVGVSMITFSAALVGTSTMQIAYDSNDEPNKIMLALAVGLLMVFVIFALVYIFIGSPTWSLLVYLPCALYAVWVWWIANAKAGTFALPADTPTGGDPTRKLPGSLEGFNS